jgi:integrase
MGGTDRFFPAIKAGRMGVLTGNWSKWWGRYMRNVIGIKDRRKVFHSFRHTFKDACREAGLGRKYTTRSLVTLTVGMRAEAMALDVTRSGRSMLLSERSPTGA